MDCIVPEVAKSRTRLNDFHFHFSLSPHLQYMQQGKLSFSSAIAHPGGIPVCSSSPLVYYTPPLVFHLLGI